MNRNPLLLRILALFLSGSLGLPASTYALRPLNAGSEESPTHSRLAGQFAGMEESLLRELQERWPVITLRGRPPSDPLTKRLLLLVSASGAQIQRLYPGPAPESRIARLTRGDDSLLIQVQEGWIGPWQGEEATLWGRNVNWQWPWIEERLASERRKILLEGKDPLERIPLYRQVYEWLQKELEFPIQLTRADRDGLETASFYIAKLGITALESARETIQVYKQEVVGLDLQRPEERLQFLIATWQRAVNEMRKTQAPESGAEVSAVLQNAAEAIQGPGVVVVDANVFPQQTGLEEFLARLPAEGRFIVVGAGSISGQEIHVRHPGVIWTSGPAETAAAILGLTAGEKVYVFGSMDLTRLLQLHLRDFLIEVSQLDLRLGLKGILLALGVPEEILQQLNWNSVESALSSLEAA